MIISHHINYLGDTLAIATAAAAPAALGDAATIDVAGFDKS